MKNALFCLDLYRYYGKNGEPFLRRLLRSSELKYLCCFRKAQAARTPLSRLYYNARLYRLSLKTTIQIPPGTKIGKGFYIGHRGRIIINPSAVLGDNINIAPGVTIGQESRGKRAGCPVIGNRCWIGTNAVIVGKIQIGDDVLIAPLSFVNFDVPDHCIVLGNPGRIIPRENATADYIMNTV